MPSGVKKGSRPQGRIGGTDYEDDDDDDDVEANDVIKLKATEEKR